jgi:hypothetical protein
VEEAAPEEGALPAAAPTVAAAEGEAQGEKVVSLDAFRKKP